MSLATELTGDHKPVLMVELDFDSAPVNIWTYPFTGEGNGKTYSPLAGLTGSLSARQSLDNASLEASAQVSGSSQEIASAALTEQFQLRPARVRLGALDSSNALVESEIILTGKMQDIPLIEDQKKGVSATVEIESVLVNLTEANDLRLSSADQAQFNADDTFFEKVESANVTQPRFGG